MNCQMRSVRDRGQFTVYGLRFTKLLLCFILLIGPGIFSNAQNPAIPERPRPPRLVNDFAGMLSSGENQQLENKLKAFNDSTSTQIAIVIINSLDGMEKGQYATELAEKRGVGDKKTDNGVLLLISKGDRQMFIATGRGVEEFLPDAVCERIFQEVIKPAFKAAKYYQGLDAATDEMMQRLRGTFVNENQGRHKKGPIPFTFIIFAIFIIIVIISSFFRNNGGGGNTISSGGWIAGALLGSALGGGGGGGGGSSDSGFGGFGGGSFGGGGAGGSW
ncbi:MAG: hypothetical protein JWO06_694 [Bacteroidota bacterium]|nr:hypothetical protein [Bacteroidota bacterium]